MVEVVRKTVPFKFSEKFKFWPNSKTNVAPPCSIAQISLKCLKEHFFLKECWNPHQYWRTNGDNIAIWMTKPPFKIQSVTNKQKKYPTFVSHAAVQRRISIKLYMKMEEVRNIFATPLDFFNPTISFGARGEKPQNRLLSKCNTGGCPTGKKFN